MKFNTFIDRIEKGEDLLKPSDPLMYASFLITMFLKTQLKDDKVKQEFINTIKQQEIINKLSE